jgi:DNA-binding CsgD family transcriptional regulator
MPMIESGINLSTIESRYDLTRMELTCLSLAADGFLAAGICKKLNASEKEIEILFYCAARKLGAKNRMHAVGIAMSRGLIGIEV